MALYVLHCTACADNCKTCNNVATLQCDGAATYPDSTDTQKGCMTGYLYKTGASGQADYCHDRQFLFTLLIKQTACTIEQYYSFRDISPDYETSVDLWSDTIAMV